MEKKSEKQVFPINNITQVNKIGVVQAFIRLLSLLEKIKSTFCRS